MDEDLAQKAVRLQEQGYNCAQAAACAFAEYLPVEEHHLYKLSEGFGGGMGNHQGICGAISGCIIVLSLQRSGGDPAHTTKKETYRLVDCLIERFTLLNHSNVCKDLLGEETGVELRSCAGCVEDAVTITQTILREEHIV